MRPSPGKTTSKLPFASFPIAAVIAESGLEIARPVRNANAETAATMKMMKMAYFVLRQSNFAVTRRIFARKKISVGNWKTTTMPSIMPL